MSKTTQDMDEMLKEYNDAKSKEDALTPIYLNQESEEFAKMWAAHGLAVYDKSTNDKKKHQKKSP